MLIAPFGSFISWKHQNISQSACSFQSCFPRSHYHCRHFAFQWTAQLKAETLLAAGDMLVVFPVPGSWGYGFPIAENRGRMEIGTDPGQWQPEVFHCVACSLLMLSIAVVIHFYCFCTHLPIKWGERISRRGGGKGGKTGEKGLGKCLSFQFQSAQCLRGYLSWQWVHF